MQKHKWLAVCGSLSIALLCISAMYFSSSRAPRGIINTIETQSTISSGSDIPPIRSLDLAPQEIKDRALTKQPAEKRTAGDEITRLIKSGAAQDKLAAFNIVERCVRLAGLNHWVVGLPKDADSDNLRDKFNAGKNDTEAYCASITQRQVLDRMQILDAAVQAKVIGAGVAFYNAGPNGVPADLELRPGDPLVVEWKQKAVEYLRQDAKLGSTDALAQLSDIYLGSEYAPRDLVLSLGYLLAQQEINRRNGKNFPPLNQFTQSIADQLSEADRASANIFKSSLISQKE